MATSKFTPIGRYHVVMKSQSDEFSGESKPVLFIDTGDEALHVKSLSDYFDDKSNKGRGYQWMRERARAVGLFYDYRLAYIKSGSPAITPLKMITNFGNAITLGTISPKNATDPLGLNWPATSLTTSRKLLKALKGFIDWCVLNEIVDENAFKINSSTSGETNYLKYLYQAYKVELKSIYSHLIDPVELAKRLAKQAEENLLFGDDKSITPTSRAIKYFPSWLVPDLLLHGFKIRGRNGEEEENITAKLITLIHFFCGTRISEPFHLWFNDIIPQVDGSTKILLRHPSDSLTNIIGEKNITRRLYLSMRNLFPRNTKGLPKSYYAGWKDLAVDQSLEAPVFFLHGSAENLIRTMFLNYLNYRKNLMKHYSDRHGFEHPFLFVSGQGSFAGEPYSMGAYRTALDDAYDRLEKRFGYKIPRGRKHGTNPHGMRHFFGQGLKDAGMDAKEVQKAMRHRSPISQLVYTEAKDSDVQMALDKAKYEIENNSNKTITPKIIEALG
ncbi:site-specific integrase [Pseudoalteromonas sp. JC28]|uniref:tyrosine-type recombinase/integrase n=1 Tax=Pseudoalteromonas sp. JC28 TaxID=2267617 RepID=UPI001574A572|nr:tyrosine-type recombinase/integrase [Pseudoalteromonas sp. JC28]NSY35543.1 site-specific integrase [Pseudoalteromonas sp. JC28]